MRKLFSFMLMAVGLLISGNVGAVDVGSLANLKTNTATPNAQIKLTSNIQLTAGETIDLNGAAIDMNSKKFICKTSGTFYVKNGTLTGGTTDVFIQSDKASTLTLEKISARTTQAYCAFINIDGCTLNVIDCDLQSSTNAILTNKSCTIHVTNSASSTNQPIKLNAAITCNLTWEINKAGIICDNWIPMTTGHAAAECIPNLIVNGTSFDFTSKYFTSAVVKNGGHLTINGGELGYKNKGNNNTKTANAVTPLLTVEDGSSVDIKSGTWGAGSITGAANCTVYRDVTVDLSYRGTINVEEGHKIDDNGVVVIDGINPAEAGAQIGDTYYEDFAAAMAAVQSGETITVLKDYAVTSTFTVDKAITINMQGKKITCNVASTNMFKLTTGADLTFNGDASSELSSSAVAMNLLNKDVKLTINGIGSTSKRVTITGDAKTANTPQYVTINSGYARIFGGVYYDKDNSNSSTFVGADKCDFRGGKFANSDKAAVDAHVISGFYNFYSPNYCTVQDEATAVVEMVGGRKYLSLYDAWGSIVDDKHPTTLKLLKDISGENKNTTNQISGDNITLDLNGYTITTTGTCAALRNNAAPTSTIIKNGTLKGNTQTNGAPLRLRYDNVTLENLTLDAAGGAAGIVLDHGVRSINMKNVTVTNATTSDIVCDFSSQTEPENTPINIVTDRAVSLTNNSQYLPVTIHAGDFSAIMNNSTKAMTIDGGSYTGTITNNGTMAIQQGQFNNIAFAGSQKAIIKAGIFTGTATGSASITGGTFADKTFATGNVVSGYKAVDVTSTTLGDVAIIVKNDVQPVIKNVETGATYYTFENALDNLQNGQTLQLTDDYEASASTVVSKQFTLELNGNKITGNADKVFIVDGGNMLVKNGEINVNNEIFYVSAGTLELQKVKATSLNGLCVDEEVKAGATAEVTIAADCQLTAEHGSTGVWLGTLPRNSANTHGTMNINGSVTANEGWALVTNGLDKGASDLVINVASTASLKGGESAAYLAGYAKTTVEGGTWEGVNTAIEIRAGELDVKGGTFTSTFEGFECTSNSSGATTKGAALAIIQHVTELPIVINISQGHFLGNYAICQYNPQENPNEYLNLLNIEVTGGYFRSTNGVDIISVTENRRLFFKGGVYNLEPEAFTVENYFSMDNNPEFYAGSYAQGYVYKVAQQSTTEVTTAGNGDWVQPATWIGGTVPNYTSDVTIGSGVVVDSRAEANTITINTGGSVTVKNGGMLIIGNGGIEGATKQNFKVENGGQVLIAPNAEATNLRGSVDLLADRAGLKPGVSYSGKGEDMYWQHIAIPTQGAPESITPSESGKTFFNTWDIMKGWQNVGKDALNTPFKGYNLGNFHPYSADGSGSITYTFVGQLVGNQPDYMVFAREGHSFFGNSYLAPLDVATLFGTLYNPDLEYTLNIYDSQTEIYQPVNEATYSILGINEIKPLQGFFIYAANATQAQLDYNSAVFTAYLNRHAVGGQTAAPARKMAKTNTYDKMVQITIAATTGEKDAIYLFEEASFSDAEDNGFDARNLEHSGLNMSIAGSYADLSVLATDNLEGALLNINTNNAVEYTMTFSHLQGDMTLTDNVTGAVIAMQEGATYTFAAQPNAQLNGRFAVNAVRTTPTNTNQVKVAPAAKGVYTMMGQYVGETANWHALPSGVYVVDGVRVSK